LHTNNRETLGLLSITEVIPKCCYDNCKKTNKQMEINKDIPYHRRHNHI
jgi:hypothetical protein